MQHLHFSIAGGYNIYHFISVPLISIIFVFFGNSNYVSDFLSLFLYHFLPSYFQLLKKWISFLFWLLYHVYFIWFVLIPMLPFIYGFSLLILCWFLPAHLSSIPIDSPSLPWVLAFLFSDLLKSMNGFPSWSLSPLNQWNSMFTWNFAVRTGIYYPGNLCNVQQLTKINGA